MAVVTNLLCNRFGGIREHNAFFTSDIITAQDIQNIELYYTGLNNGVGIRTAKGNASINNDLVGTAKIIKIFESVQQQRTFFFLYAENLEKGTFYSYDIINSELTVLKDNLTPTHNANGFDLSQGWSDLFFFTNGTEMFTIEMDAFNVATIVDMELTDMDGRPVVGLNAAVFDNRLWIASNNVVWYSVKADIYDFATHDAQVVTSSGYIELLKNITAIHEYLGALAVFFSDSSLLIMPDANGIFSVGNDSPGGCAGYNSLVFHDTDLFFYDDTKKSVFSFKQIVTGEKTLGQNIATEVQSILKRVDSTKLNDIQVCSVFIEGRNEIWWIIPTNDIYETEEIENDVTRTVTKEASIILIYDYLKGEWIKRKSQKINSVAVVNGTLYSAGNNGSILEEYISDSFNGDYIPCYYNCSPCNLGANNTLKIFVYSPRVTFSMPFNNQFYVKYVKNFDIYKKPKIKFIKSKLKNFLYWDKGFWDKNYWPSKNTSVIGKLPSATFKVLELSFFSENESQTFSIKNIEFSKVKIKQV